MEQVRGRVEASRPAPEAARGPHRAGAHRLDLGGVGVLGGPGRLHGGEAVVAGIMR